MARAAQEVQKELLSFESKVRSFKEGGWPVLRMLGSAPYLCNAYKYSLNQWWQPNLQAQLEKKQGLCRVSVMAVLSGSTSSAGNIGTEEPWLLKHQITRPKYSIRSCTFDRG